MSKPKPKCFFCGRDVNTQEIYYIITGPDGSESEVHGHEGVPNIGKRMLAGKPLLEEKN